MSRVLEHREADNTNVHDLAAFRLHKAKSAGEHSFALSNRAPWIADSLVPKAPRWGADAPGVDQTAIGFSEGTRYRPVHGNSKQYERESHIANKIEQRFSEFEHKHNHKIGMTPHLVPDDVRNAFRARVGIATPQPNDMGDSGTAFSPKPGPGSGRHKLNILHQI